MRVQFSSSSVLAQSKVSTSHRSLGVSHTDCSDFCMSVSPSSGKFLENVSLYLQNLASGMWAENIQLMLICLQYELIRELLKKLISQIVSEFTVLGRVDKTI